MARIITFGEIMLRLMPQDGHRFLQNEWLEATYGGGEANVAVSLANYGEKAAFVTALPDNDIAQACINSLRYFGVDTEKILRQGDRIGVYYVEKGQSQRPSKVIYDRKGSSIASAHRDDFHWDEIFDCVEWFHWTGITPALSDSLKEICMDACQEAKKRGITISCDLNYRKNLWTEAEAYNTMTKLVPYVDLCIANEEDAEKVLGIKAKNSDVNSGKLDREGRRLRDIAEDYRHGSQDKRRHTGPCFHEECHRQLELLRVPPEGPAVQRQVGSLHRRPHGKRPALLAWRNQPQLVHLQQADLREKALRKHKRAARHRLHRPSGPTNTWVPLLGQHHHWRATPAGTQDSASVQV